MTTAVAREFPDSADADADTGHDGCHPILPNSGAVRLLIDSIGIKAMGE